MHMEVLMKRVLVASVGVLAGTYALGANAQEAKQPGYFEKELAAPVSAFEIGVSGKYNQGFGNLTSGAPAGTSRRLQDTAGPGVGGELDLGWRIAPALSLGLYGAGTEFDRQSQLASGTNVRSLTAGAQAQWFLRPYHAVDPWVSLASGYRGFWLVPDVGGVTSRHGWQIARLQVGVDMRTSRAVSIGPFVGGSVDTFFTEKVPGGSYRNLSGPPVAGFFEAGLIGRFDLGGRYVQRASVIAAR
jgi:hypothetical protein